MPSMIVVLYCSGKCDRTGVYNGFLLDGINEVKILQESKFEPAAGFTLNIKFTLVDVLTQPTSPGKTTYLSEMDSLYSLLLRFPKEKSNFNFHQCITLVFLTDIM